MVSFNFPYLCKEAVNGRIVCQKLSSHFITRLIALRQFPISQSKHSQAIFSHQLVHNPISMASVIDQNELFHWFMMLPDLLFFLTGEDSNALGLINACTSRKQSFWCSLAEQIVLILIFYITRKRVNILYNVFVFCIRTLAFLCNTH